MIQSTYFINFQYSIFFSFDIALLFKERRLKYCLKKRKKRQAFNVHKWVTSSSDTISISFFSFSSTVLDGLLNKSRTCGRDIGSSGFVVVAYSPIYSDDLWYVPLKLAEVNGAEWRLGSLIFEDDGELFEGSFVGDADLDRASSATDERRHGQIRSAAVVPPNGEISSIESKRKHKNYCTEKTNTFIFNTNRNRRRWMMSIFCWS